MAAQATTSLTANARQPAQKKPGCCDQREQETIRPQRHKQNRCNEQPCHAAAALSSCHLHRRKPDDDLQEKHKRSLKPRRAVNPERRDKGQDHGDGNAA